MVSLPQLFAYSIVFRKNGSMELASVQAIDHSQAWEKFKDMKLGGAVPVSPKFLALDLDNFRVLNTEGKCLAMILKGVSR